MARLTPIALVLALLFACGPAPSDPPPPAGGGGGGGEMTEVDTDSSLTIVNGSNYTIMYMYMSPTSQATWGPDQLGSNVLAPGDSITLTGISCDTWDVRLVDEDDDECIVEAVPICAEDGGWHITNEALLECEGY